MFLDTQNQFDPEHLEPGYAEAYAAFAEENKEVLYTWSKGEIAERFSDYLSKKVERDLVALIEASPADEAKKKADLNLAKRGQLLLVSTDEGKTFDQYLTIEEAKRVNPLAYQILSPTFRSTTTNLMEVVGEQTLLHVVSTMNQNFSSVNAAEKTIWSVKNATLKNGAVHVEVSRTATNPEAQEDANSMVEVEVDQDPALKDLVYKQLDKDGNVKRFPETQLGNEYGEAKQDPTLQMPSKEALAEEVLSASDNGADSARNAVFATTLSMLALQEAAQHATPEQRAREAAALAKSSIERPMGMPGSGDFNVTAAKAAIAARFARQNQANQANHEHEHARNLQIKNEKSTVHAKKVEAEKQKKARWTADQKRLARNSAAGTGFIGSILSLIGGTSVFTLPDLFF